MADVLLRLIVESDQAKAEVKAVIDSTEKIGEAAAKAGKEAADSFKQAGQAAAAAFSSKEVKKSLDDQIKSVDELKIGIKQLYDEEIKLLSAGKKNSEAYKKNIEDAAELRVELQKLTGGIVGQAKATQQVEKQTISLKTQLARLRNELSELEKQGKDNTTEFQRISVEAAKLSNQINTTQQRIASLASDTFKFDAAVGAVQGLAGAFAAAQGAAALFGGESKDLEKVIAKTQGAISLLNGVQEIANLLTGQSAVKLAVLSAAQSAYTTVVGTSTGAMKLFRIALASTGIGLLVIGLIELVQNFSKVKEAITNAIPGFEAISEGIGNVIDKTKEFLGIDDGGENSKKALDNLIGVEKRRTQFQVQAIDRRIALLEAENKETAQLEIEREQIQIESLKRQQKAIKDGTDQLIKLDIEGRKEIREKADAINAEILDREVAIQLIRIKNRREAVKSTIELETLGLTKLIEIREAEIKLETDFAQSSKTLKLSVLELERAAGDESLQNTIDIIKEKARLEQEALGLSLEDSIKRQTIQANAEKAITEATRQEQQKRIDLIFEYAAAIQGVFNQLNELSKQQTENRIADINLQSQTELAAINASFDTERQKQRERSALELRTNRQIAAEKTKQAKQDKALALFNATIFTAQQIAKYAGNIPLMILAGLAGAAQIAIIASKPIPKFEKGGWIKGKRHSQGGELIEGETDEFIVKRDRAVKHPKLLEAMNTSSRALSQYIDKNYVRPAVMNYMLGKKQDSMSVNVNATLNSQSMENEIKGLRRDMRKRINQSNKPDNRYSWHNQ